MDAALLAATARAAHSAVPDPDLPAVVLDVRGDLPVGLEGTLITVGPNTDDLAGWGMGPGLVHAVRFTGGDVTCASRSVDAGADARPDTVEARASLRSGRGNSNLVVHAGRLLALHEVGLPIALDGELRTVGLHDFDGRLSTAMCAHPRVDPVSGELVFFGCALTPPFVTYHAAGADGVLHTSVPIEMPCPTSMHDFAVTERWAVFVDQPNVVSFLGLLRGEVSYVWEPDHRPRLGLLDRGRPDDPLRWIDTPARDVTHVLNAFDDDGAVVIDVVARTPDDADPARLDLFPTLRRWRVATDGSSFREVSLCPLGIENPKIDERLATRRHRCAYGIEMGGVPGGPGNFMSTVGWLAIDTETGTMQRHRVGDGVQLGQAVFAPRPGGSAHDDDGGGWVVGTAYDHLSGVSEVRVLDATALHRGPRAVVALPRRVPATLDAIWVPAGAGW